MSFLGVLGAIFVAFKLAGIVDWSWWLVLLPLYGPAFICVALACIMVFIEDSK